MKIRKFYRIQLLHSLDNHLPLQREYPGLFHKASSHPLPFSTFCSPRIPKDFVLILNQFRAGETPPVCFLMLAVLGYENAHLRGCYPTFCLPEISSSREFTLMKTI